MLQNLNCDKKISWLQNPNCESRINSNCDKTKKKNCDKSKQNQKTKTKLKNSNCENTLRKPVIETNLIC